MSKLDQLPKVNANKWLKHRSRYSESRRELKEATLANQATLKAAKADGVHIDAMKLVAKFDNMDPMEARSLFTAFVQGAIVQKCEFMVQGDMLAGGNSLADLFTPEQPTPRSIEAFEEGKAYELGYNEALGGGSVSNLHAVFGPGSALLVQALKGWERGSDLAEKYASPGVKKAPASGRGRRGKMAAAGDDAEEAETSSEESSGDLDFDSKEEIDADAELNEALSSEPAGVPTAELTRDKLAKMSNTELAKVYSEITGATTQRFESKAVAIAKIEGALAHVSHAAN